MADRNRETMLANFVLSGPPEITRALEALMAERDRLRRALHESVEEFDELIAERDRLRAEVAIQTNASDAAAEAVGLMAEKLSATLAENTRLRAVVDAAHELLDEDRTSWSPWHAQLAEALAALDGSGAMGDGSTEGDHGRGDDRDRVADPLRAAGGDLSQADGQRRRHPERP